MKAYGPKEIIMDEKSTWTPGLVYEVVLKHVPPSMRLFKQYFSVHGSCCISLTINQHVVIVVSLVGIELESNRSQSINTKINFKKITCKIRSLLRIQVSWGVMSGKAVRDL